MPHNKKQPSKKYKNPELNKPMVIEKPELGFPPIGTWGSEEKLKEFVESKRKTLSKKTSANMPEMFRRFFLLVEEYEIENTQDRWLMLAFRLAFEYVPGLQIKYRKPAGRPKNDTELFLLYFTVRDKREASPSLSFKSICHNLAKQEQWRHVKAGALYNNYLKVAKSNEVRIFKTLEKNMKVRFTADQISKAMIANDSNEN